MKETYINGKYLNIINEKIGMGKCKINVGKI